MKNLLTISNLIITFCVIYTKAINKKSSTYCLHNLNFTFGTKQLIKPLYLYHNIIKQISNKSFDFINLHIYDHQFKKCEDDLALLAKTRGVSKLQQSILGTY